MGVFNRVKGGENVFFTGSAGTGKSVLLREIIAWCREKYTPERVAVTASTGIAAINIGGCTLHSWSRVKLGKEPAHVLARRMFEYDENIERVAREDWETRRNTGSSGMGLHEYIWQRRNHPSNPVYRWRTCAVLIIDESTLFDKLEYIATVMRDVKRPFGGIQLVLSGDFLQLPPVPDREMGIEVPSTFAFQAFTWSRCIEKPVYLSKVFRQKEQRFVDMLNAIRVGNLDQRIISELRKLNRPLRYPDGIQPTELYSTKREVEVANSSRLQALALPYEIYHAIDKPGCDKYGAPLPKDFVDLVLQQLVAPKEIALKRGAQVMLIKNLIPGRLVNGSRGVVIDFVEARKAYTSGIKFGLLQCLHQDKKDPPDDILGSDRKWPLVKFEHDQILCVNTFFDALSASGNVEATRRQIPLILAWALSIHKCQGQTLDRVKVDLRTVFEHGQAYVALSRATSIKALEIGNFDPAKIAASPQVLQWMEENSSRDEVDDDLEFWAELLE